MPGKKNGKKATRSSSSENPFKSSSIRKAAQEVFKNPAEFLGDVKENQKAIFYGYVELDNEESLNICRQFEFQPTTQFQILPFSRLSPKKDERVGLVYEKEKEAVKASIRGAYEHCSFFTPQGLFRIGDYYVLRKKGEIVAGVQAIPEKWVIENLGGLSGSILMGLLPRLPWLSRLFNPNDFNFLLFEGGFWKPGHIEDYLSLLESVLWEKGYYSAMILADEKDESLNHIKNLGTLARFTNCRARAVRT